MMKTVACLLLLLSVVSADNGSLNPGSESSQLSASVSQSLASLASSSSSSAESSSPSSSSSSSSSAASSSEASAPSSSSSSSASSGDSSSSAASSSSSESSGEFVNHNLDPLVQLLDTLRHKKSGLNEMTTADVKTLEIEVRALLANIEKFRGEKVDALPHNVPEPTEPAAVPETHRACHEDDSCNHLIVVAKAVSSLCQSDPCDQKTVQPTIVSSTSSCNSCHVARTTCESTCSQDDSCHQCVTAHVACQSSCQSDVVRVDTVHPYTASN